MIRLGTDIAQLVAVGMAGAGWPGVATVSDNAGEFMVQFTGDDGVKFGVSAGGRITQNRSEIDLAKYIVERLVQWRFEHERSLGPKANGSNRRRLRQVLLIEADADGDEVLCTHVQDCIARLSDGSQDYGRTETYNGQGVNVKVTIIGHAQQWGKDDVSSTKVLR